MRLKIIAGNVVAVLIVGVAVYFFVHGQLQTGLASGFEESVQHDAVLFARSWELAGRQFLDRVADQAKSERVIDSFAGLDDGSRRARAHQTCNAIATWFGDPARGRRGMPDIVVIVDETGETVSRNLDQNRSFPARRLGAVRQTLRDGIDRVDVWFFEEEGKVLEVGIGRVETAEGAVLGALVVGYVISDGFADEEARLLGREVAFVTETGVTATSLEGPIRDSLKDYLFGPQAAAKDAALDEEGGPTVWKTTLDGGVWIGSVAPLPRSASYRIAYVVMGNETAATELAGVANWILAGTLFCVLCVLIYGFIIGTSFIRPLEQIEEGVLAVINGRTDTRIDVQSGEFGGLAYRINQLINVFTGVEEADDDGRVSAPPGPPSQSSAWNDAAFNADAAARESAVSTQPAQPGDPVDDPAVATALASEPEDAYFARLYTEYVAAKAAVGEDVGNVPQERFAQRLKKNADALAQKHGCRMVRFRVETRDNQVTLQPVLIR
jgi:hypothetical protein